MHHEVCFTAGVTKYMKHDMKNENKKENNKNLKEKKRKEDVSSYRTEIFNKFKDASFMLEIRITVTNIEQSVCHHLS